MMNINNNNTNYVYSGSLTIPGATGSWNVMTVDRGLHGMCWLVEDGDDQAVSDGVIGSSAEFQVTSLFYINP